MKDMYVGKAKMTIKNPFLVIHIYIPIQIDSKDSLHELLLIMIHQKEI